MENYDFTLPGGTFCAIEPDRFVAMLAVKRIGKKLAEDHPELADVYRDTTKPFSTEAISMELLSSERERSVVVAQKAVTYAVRLLIPEDELQVITSTRRSIAMVKRWDFNSPEWKEHCRLASIARHSKGIGVDVNAMLAGRNRKAWTAKEKEFLFSCATNDTYRKPTGGPDYLMIATEINQRFHDGKEVRYYNSCCSMVADIRRKA